jgi:hypothetical protein
MTIKSFDVYSGFSFFYQLRDTTHRSLLYPRIARRKTIDGR